MRYIVSLILGLAVAFGLFALMDRLISSDEEATLSATSVQMVDFVRVKRDEATRTKERQVPQKPEPPKKPPPPQMAAQSDPTRPTPPQMNINMPNIGTSFAGSGPFIGPYGGPANMGDGDVIPIVQIEPQYPREALLRCQAGVVTMEFTILEDGSVEDPKVISADPPRLFDRNALRAIVRWKFKPRIVDGRPVKRRATLPLEFKLPEGC